MSPNERRLRVWEQECKADGRHIPWVRVGSFSSSGTQHRVGTSLDDLVSHLHSNGEKALFLRLAFRGQCRRILSQVPLYPLDQVAAIARAIGKRMPRDPRFPDWAVLSTDLVTEKVIGSKLVKKAYAVKPSSELNGVRAKSVETKLAIEKAVWLYRGCEWELVISDGLDEVETFNIQRLYQQLLNHPFSGSNEIKSRFCAEFLRAWTPDRGLVDILKRVEKKLSIDEMDGWTLFADSVRTNELNVDLTFTINERGRVFLLERSE